jgi:Glycine-zipper domain
VRRDAVHTGPVRGFEMPASRPVAALTAMLALGACAVVPPTGPAVLALPPQGKDLAQFQQEDGSCREYAAAQIGYGSPAQAASQSAVGSAALGTALGAAAGALLGAAAGGAGVGAAFGAGTGLLFGSAVGANNAYASGGGLQLRYDLAYAQCMTARGNRLQALPAAPYYLPNYGPYAYPAYYAYPVYYGP